MQVAAAIAGVSQVTSRIIREATRKCYTQVHVHACTVRLNMHGMVRHCMGACQAVWLVYA